MKRIYAFTLLSLVLLVSAVAALVPSESALEAAGPYRRSGEEATVVNRPYVVDAHLYWIVYFHSQTNPGAKNAVVVVDADSGGLVTDERTLLKVYTFDFKLGFLQDFLREKKLSFTDLRSAVDVSKPKRDQAEVTLDNLQDSLEREGKSVASVQSAFSPFSLQAERLTDNIDAGVEMEALFDNEYSFTAFEAVLGSYSSAYATLSQFLTAGAAYQRVVINTSNDLTAQGVEQGKFKPQLQSAYDVGLDKFPLPAAFQSALGEFNSLNSTQNLRLVNDSVQSFLYRKGKVDSDAVVESVRGQVGEVLARKAEINECTGTGQLERAWDNALQSQTTNRFTGVQGNVSIVKAELDRVKREFDLCTGSPTEDKPVERRDDTNLYIGGVILLLIAYLGYTYYKKKKAQAEEGNESGKGSLFNR